MKGRALRRALETSDALRVNTDLPAIVDTTELITPTYAQELLKRNANNRPINWRKVEDYAAVMRQGQWKLTAQGIVIDVDDNILTGQKRLWAVIYSDTNVYMRVSRGNASETAKILDRGTPQTARDLASRDTGKRHSPAEASLARVCCVLGGTLKPDVDSLGQTLATNSVRIAAVLKETTGTRKTRAILMVLGAIVSATDLVDEAQLLALEVERLADDLTKSLAPQTPESCWGRGAAFSLALQRAEQLVKEEKAKLC